MPSVHWNQRKVTALNIHMTSSRVKRRPSLQYVETNPRRFYSLSLAALVLLTLSGCAAARAAQAARTARAQALADYEFEGSPEDLYHVVEDFLSDEGYAVMKGGQKVIGEKSLMGGGNTRIQSRLLEKSPGVYDIEFYHQTMRIEIVQVQVQRRRSSKRYRNAPQTRNEERIRRSEGIDTKMRQRFIYFVDPGARDHLEGVYEETKAASLAASEAKKKK